MNTLDITIPENYVFVFDKEHNAVGMADQERDHHIVGWITFSSIKKAFEFREMLNFIIGDEY
jgi:hypothetical protein